VNCAGQDKGHGPKGANPLSAHRFCRDVARRKWDVESAGLPIALRFKGGTQPVLGVFGYFCGVGF